MLLALRAKEGETRGETEIEREEREREGGCCIPRLFFFFHRFF